MLFVFDCANFEGTTPKAEKNFLTKISSIGFTVRYGSKFRTSITCPVCVFPLKIVSTESRIAQIGMACMVGIRWLWMVQVF